MTYARLIVGWLMRFTGQWLVEWGHRVDGTGEGEE